MEAKVRKFDKRGNEIYSEWSDGYWIKLKYDKNCNLIYRENSKGDKQEYKYDKDDNEIYYREAMRPSLW